MLLRIGLVIGFIVGVGVLAYQVGSRLSDEAIMTLVGVLCGILASIPVSIGLLIALTRERSPVYDDDPAETYFEPAPHAYPVDRPPQPPAPPPLPQTPQIIVVAPPQPQLPPNLAGFPNYLLPPTAALPTPMQERNFKIVGEDEGE